MMTSTPTTTKTTRTLPAFFILTLILSLPFYILAALIPPDMAILVGLALTLAPISAALILTFRQDRSTGAKKLVKREFEIVSDYHFLLASYLQPGINSVELNQGANHGSCFPARGSTGRIAGFFLSGII
jgi:hypothetical protein